MYDKVTAAPFLRPSCTSLQVLQTILGLERLDRMTAFAEELAAGFPPPPPSSLGLPSAENSALADDEGGSVGSGGPWRQGGGGGGALSSEYATSSGELPG